MEQINKIMPKSVYFIIFHIEKHLNEHLSNELTLWRGMNGERRARREERASARALNPPRCNADGV